jgi:putative Mn2+ efflux pump MntP
MNFASTALLAFAMSADAFAAAIGKGAELDKPRFGEALKTPAKFAPPAHYKIVMATSSDRHERFAKLRLSMQ